MPDERIAATLSLRQPLLLLLTPAMALIALCGVSRAQLNIDITQGNIQPMPIAIPAAVAFQ